jgi:hypothetical protein
MNSLRVAGLMLAVSCVGCMKAEFDVAPGSAASRHIREDHEYVYGEITGATASHVDVELHDTKEKVSLRRTDIKEIKHPGQKAAIAGTVMMSVGTVPAGVGGALMAACSPPSCKESGGGNPGFIMGIGLLAIGVALVVSGIPLAVSGYPRWSTSARLAEPSKNE